MRIAANSCKGCLGGGSKIYPNGRHVDENGLWYICPFVTAELADIRDVELISVHKTRRAAIRASGGHGPIQWIGQAPVEMWLALRDNPPRGAIVSYPSIQDKVDAKRFKADAR